MGWWAGGLVGCCGLVGDVLDWWVVVDWRVGGLAGWWVGLRRCCKSIPARATVMGRRNLRVEASEALGFAEARVLRVLETLEGSFVRVLRIGEALGGSGV